MISNSLEEKLDKNETVGNEAFKWSLQPQPLEKSAKNTFPSN